MNKGPEKFEVTEELPRMDDGARLAQESNELMDSALAVASGNKSLGEIPDEHRNKVGELIRKFNDTESGERLKYDISSLASLDSNMYSRNAGLTKDQVQENFRRLFSGDKKVADLPFYANDKGEILRSSHIIQPYLSARRSWVEGRILDGDDAEEVEE